MLDRSGCVQRGSCYSLWAFLHYETGNSVTFGSICSFKVSSIGAVLLVKFSLSLTVVVELLTIWYICVIVVVQGSVAHLLGREISPEH